jgi:hypothetical protein
MDINLTVQSGRTACDRVGGQRRETQMTRTADYGLRLGFWVVFCWLVFEIVRVGIAG